MQPVGKVSSEAIHFLESLEPVPDSYDECERKAGYVKEFLHAGQFENAEKAAAKIPSTSSFREKAHSRIAKNMARSGRDVEALAFARKKILGYFLDIRTVVTGIATATARGGRPERALEIIEKEIQDDCENPYQENAYWSLAIKLVKMGQYEEAIAVAKKMTWETKTTDVLRRVAIAKIERSLDKEEGKLVDELTGTFADGLTEFDKSLVVDAFVRRGFKVGALAMERKIADLKMRDGIFAAIPAEK